MLDKRKIFKAGIPLALSVFLLSACNDDDDDEVTASRYTVSITNNTAHQPLSPVAAILHNAGYHSFVSGESASVGLELLAEAGDNTTLLEEARANDSYLASVGGSGPIGPGATATLTLETEAGSPYLSVVSMLVNTNDAFTALDAYDLSGLASGDSVSMNLFSWDAGTEANTEAEGTIPGPADAGEGFNVSREGDVDRVAIHAGVISAQDGLSSSVLDASYRFDNPVARVTVTRTQ